MKIRGRFAPTPSGPLHLGNAWSALLAWLQVRQAGGEMLLRIEDIDGPRSRQAYIESIPEDLRWLGLDWDEGPDLGGPYSPYRQSERLARYEELLHVLKAKGLVYPCYCSRAELAAIASAPHGLAAEGPAYPGICRTLSEPERATRAERKTPSWRFVMPAEPVAFEDLAMGPQSFPAGYGGDFIVKRADGIYAYQLAVVADDADMAVTHVLRGSDLLDSTPRQLALFDALGLPEPRYAHVPLLYGPDGQRLAKRHGSASIGAMRQSGISPETIVGWLGYLAGCLPKPEPAKPRDLLPYFRLDAVPPGPIRLEPAMLDRLGIR